MAGDSPYGEPKGTATVSLLSEPMVDIYYSSSCFPPDNEKPEKKTKPKEGNMNKFTESQERFDKRNRR